MPFTCIDDTMKGTSLERWVDLIMEGTSKMGKDWTRVRKYKEYLENAGFVDVVERKYEWPVGTVSQCPSPIFEPDKGEC